MNRKSVLVSSNCQTDTITEALQVLLPEYDVSSSHIPGNTTNKDYLDVSLQTGVDCLVTSNPICFEREFQDKWHKTNIIKIPTIDFAAFHPDIVYAVDDKNQTVRCLDSDYHSALVLWGWKNDLDADQIVNLFRSEIFYQIGYFGAWESGVKNLQDRFIACAFDFTAFWRRIKRGEPFMHSINHPKVFVLAELAQQAAQKISGHLSEDHSPIEELLTDQLSAIRWPIYPEIGKLYGVRGMYKWKIRKSKYLSLAEYVTSALESYSSTRLEKNQLNFHSLGYDQLNASLRKSLGLQNVPSL